MNVKQKTNAHFSLDASKKKQSKRSEIHSKSMKCIMSETGNLSFQQLSIYNLNLSLQRCHPNLFCKRLYWPASNDCTQSQAKIDKIGVVVVCIIEYLQSTFGLFRSTIRLSSKFKFIHKLISDDIVIRMAIVRSEEYLDHCTYRSMHCALINLSK